jgi:hypothetical protein
VANIFRSRFDFESAANPISYEPHKAGYQQGLRHKRHAASEGYLRLGGTIPLLEKDSAVPLEFLRPLVHLLPKYGG